LTISGVSFFSVIGDNSRNWQLIPLFIAADRMGFKVNLHFILRRPPGAAAVAKTAVFAKTRRLLSGGPQNHGIH
jgi:hypothetical protein